VISSVAVTQAPQRAAVRVEGEGRLSVRAARMQDPERLVLDFAGARLAVQKTVIPGVSAPVRGCAHRAISSGCCTCFLFVLVFCIFFDLTRRRRYQLSRDAGAVVIYFDAQPAEPAAAPANAATLTSENKLIASGISLYRCVAPAVGAPHFQEFANFRSSLRVASETDPALSRSSIVQREEGTCSSGWQCESGVAEGGFAAGDDGRHNARHHGFAVAVFNRECSASGGGRQIHWGTDLR